MKWTSATQIGVLSATCTSMTSTMPKTRLQSTNRLLSPLPPSVTKLSTTCNSSNNAMRLPSHRPNSPLTSLVHALPFESTPFATNPVAALSRYKNSNSNSLAATTIAPRHASHSIASHLTAPQPRRLRLLHPPRLQPSSIPAGLTQTHSKMKPLSIAPSAVR